MTVAITRRRQEAVQLRPYEASRAARSLQARHAVARSDSGPSSTAAPVLLVASGPAVRTIQTALGSKFALTVTDNAARARALAATGGFLAVLAVEPTPLKGATIVDPAKPDSIAVIVTKAIERIQAIEHDDPIAELPYEEYIELARYATTRRYLIALLRHHGGSVTDAARGANMKRESLHRLMRRHHLIADDFRER